VSLSPVGEFFRTGRASRPPLITTLFYRAAALEGVAVEDLLFDPARLARALLDQQRLFATDVVTVKLAAAIHLAAGRDLGDADPETGPRFAALDAVPSAEAVLAVAAPLIDTIGRIAALVKPNLPVLAVVPGPAALARGLDGAAASATARVLRVLVEAACKAGAGLVQIEDVAGEADARLAGPTVNTARYYTAQVIVAGDPTAPRALADGVLLGDAADLAAAVARTGAGPRIGMRLDPVRRGSDPVLDPTGLPERYFLSVDDAGIAGLTVERIADLFSSLRTRSFP
jgi:hypothetical protein